MIQRKKSGNTLVGSVLTLLWCFTMLVGNTFAWSDESDDTNLIVADSLDLSMEWLDGAAPITARAVWQDAESGPIFGDDVVWEPGYTAARYIKIGNNGDIPIVYQLSIKTEDTAEVGILANVIDVYYIDGVTSAIADRGAFNEDNRIGTLAEVMAGTKQAQIAELAARDSRIVAIALKMQESAGNSYEEKSVCEDGFSVRLLATSKTENDQTTE